MSADLSRINNTLGKFVYYFSNHNNILVSVSGGSDSDIIVHIVATYMRDFLHKVHFVYVNTGLEYQATKDHLKYLEEKYNIQIERIRGKSVVWAVKHYGVPVLSKAHSKLIEDIQHGTPYAAYAWEHLDTFLEKYKARQVVEKMTPAFRKMVSECDARGINVSYKCCDVSKKAPVIGLHKGE